MPRPPAFQLLLLLSISSALALRLCSFNVRSFGEAKKENKNAMDVITKVRPLPVRGSAGCPSCPLSAFSLEETPEKFQRSWSLRGKVAAALASGHNPDSNHSNNHSPSLGFMSSPERGGCWGAMAVPPCRKVGGQRVSWYVKSS